MEAAGIGIAVLLMTLGAVHVAFVLYRTLYRTPHHGPWQALSFTWYFVAGITAVAILIALTSLILILHTPAGRFSNIEVLMLASILVFGLGLILYALFRPSHSQKISRFMEGAMQTAAHERRHSHRIDLPLQRRAKTPEFVLEKFQSRSPAGKDDRAWGSIRTHKTPLAKAG